MFSKYDEYKLYYNYLMTVGVAVTNRLEQFDDLV